MDILGWIGWLLWTLLGLAWSVIWFLLGGWVSTLAQIAVLALIIFGYKYGWRRAPQEIIARTSSFGRFAWAWIRSKEPPQAAAQARDRSAAPSRRSREFGDVNISTLMSLVTVAGLGILALM